MFWYTHWFKFGFVFILIFIVDEIIKNERVSEQTCFLCYTIVILFEENEDECYNVQEKLLIKICITCK